MRGDKVDATPPPRGATQALWPVSGLAKTPLHLPTRHAPRSGYVPAQ